MITNWRVLDRTPHQVRIAAFMKKAGQDLPTAPIVPNLEIRRLRASLIMEETMETIRALGLKVSITQKPAGHDAGTHIDNMDDCDWSFSEWEEPNLVEIADGCADISVVTIGTLSACGICDKQLLEMIDESNLAKFGPGGHRREDGKWIKPPDWVKPDIAGLIEQMQKA